MDEQAPTTTAPLEKPLTVLVADDHPLWRDALARDLADHGIDVVGTAGDGPAAVARTRATRPEVLLLDLNLPEMRGDEVCTAIGDLTTKVLILSASGEEPDVLAAVKAGASGYLVKSASPAEIRDAVTATLEISADLPGREPVLEAELFAHLETAYDLLVLEVSADGGESWTPLPGRLTARHQEPVEIPDGTITGWGRRVAWTGTFPLVDASGREVRAAQLPDAAQVVLVVDLGVLDRTVGHTGRPLLERGAVPSRTLGDHGLVGEHRHVTGHRVELEQRRLVVAPDPP